MDATNAINAGINANVIAAGLALFFGPADVFEVRALGVGHPRRQSAGWFRGDQLSLAAAKIAAVAEIANGVYFTPNPCDPACRKRASGNLVPVRKSKSSGEAQPRLTHDDDVPFRRWLIIDVDPIRPEEAKKQSATDAEKAAALTVAGSIFNRLRQWPLPPILVDSGNGYHLYYRFVTPENGGAAISPDPLAGVLRAMARLHDTSGASVDTAVFNAARIMKVPGTPSRKGRPTSERPHRASRIMEVPIEWHA
jgi:hypothetical protein